jgi:hypothetical protein
MTDITIPDAVEHNTIVEAPNEAVDHVVRHEGLIKDLQNELQKQREETFAAIETTRSELTSAIESARTEQASMLESKLARLEEISSKLEQQIQEPVQDEIPPADALPLVPEIESTTKVTIPKGSRQRRLARHQERRGKKE